MRRTKSSTSPHAAVVEAPFMMGHPAGLIYREANGGGSHFATHVSKDYGQR